ncbi:hypothetical protein ACFXK0_12975 [Nocardia sp. NPDC059177]|uniref:hypothetical protein n=1 Tax=Nocardia sp. NPDC059177 TaxID=3346759 RepID=UPI0036A7BB67
MTLSSRAVRTGTVVLAITAGLATGAGTAAAESPSDSGSALGTGSAELAQSLFTAIGCYVGANNCGSIVIPT